MQLQVDLEISSTDERVNSFKPNPEGLMLVLSQMNITNKANCLFLGDRDELDGQCARTLGIPFLLIHKKIAMKDLYHKLAAKITEGMYKNKRND